MYRLCEIVSRLSREAVPWAQALQEHTAAPTEPIRRSLRSLSAARRELRGLPVRCTLWGEEIDADVLDFCSRESLLDYLPLALELVGECFPSARALRVQVEQDPETDDEWLTLNFTVHGETDDILDQHDEYTDRWISAVPWPESDKICLCYEVA
jgi:hypothetical protein